MQVKALLLKKIYFVFSLCMCNDKEIIFLANFVQKGGFQDGLFPVKAFKNL